MQVAERLHGATGGAHRREWPAWLGRAGLVGRGILYVVVGWLAVRLAFGNHSSSTDQKGALVAVTRAPFGRWLVLFLGGLFVAYSLYRFALAAIAPDDENPPKRAYLALRGFLYVAFAWVAFRLALGTEPAQSSGESQRDLTVRALEWPAGRWIVAAVGLGVIGQGLWHGWRAATGRFADDLKEDEMPEGVQHTLTVVGTIGSVARGVAFLLVGAFLTHVGWSFDPAAPVGLDESLARLASNPWGPLALIAVGAGLVAYGLFAIARARYERIMGQ